MDRVRDRLIERLERARPRVLRLVAAVGWGKSTIARAIAGRSQSSAICTFQNVASAADARERLAAAIAGATQTSPADFLATWRAGRLDVLVLDDVHELTNVAATDLLAPLLVDIPADSLLVLVADASSHVDVSPFIAPHEVLTLTRADLMPTVAEQYAIIAGDGAASPELVKRAAALSRGWPVALLLFARLAREGSLAAAVDDPAGPLLHDLHDYFVTSVFPKLPDDLLDAAALCAAFDGATVEDVAAAIGPAARSILETLVTRAASVDRIGDTYHVGPLAGAALRASRAERTRVLLMAGVSRLRASGKQLRAAEFAIAAGDESLAGEILDALAVPDDEASLIRYTRVAQRLSLPILTATRWPFVVFLCSRAAAADADRLYDRVVDFSNRLGSDASPAVYLSTRVAVAAATALTFRTREAQAEFIAIERDADITAIDEERQRMIAAFRAFLAAGDGRFSEYDAYADGAERGQRRGHDVFNWLWLTADYFRGFYLGDFERVRDAAARHVAYARAWRDPLIASHALGYAVHFEYLTTSETALPDIVGQAERILDENSQHVADHREYVRYGRIETGTSFPTYFTCIATIDAAFSQRDAERATRLVDVALDGLDRIGQPIAKILGRLAAAALPGASSDRLYRDAAALADDCESPPLRAELDALVNGIERTGPFAAFRERLRRQPLMRSATVIRVKLMTDAVERAGRDIDVRPREYQVLAALAIAGTAISIERFTDELWPEADPAMATQALRMTVHRLRRALGDVQAILSVRAGYQLAGDVAIDLVEANEFLRALRRLPSLAAYDRTRLRQLFEQLTAARLGDPATDNSWTRRRDRTIARLRHEAGMLVAEDELAQDQPLLALEAAETLLRFDELDEPAIEIMLRALTQSGQRLEAARRYRDYVEQLAAEMQSRPAFSFEG